MKIKQITDVIERFAPLAWQAPYDNAGLIVGRPDDEVHAALLAVDVTDEVLDEAEREGCDLVITHHPIVFHALKRFNSADMVQRCVERAIRRGIALYACHTNLDSAPGGMSWYLAGQLGVENLRVLEPSDADAKVGFGVVGELPEPMAAAGFMRLLQKELAVRAIRHRHRPRRGAPCSRLHRGRGFAHRCRPGRRGRFLRHGRPQVQRLHDPRFSPHGGRRGTLRERILRNSAAV